MKRPGWIVRYKGEKRWRNVFMMLVADLFIVSMGILVSLLLLIVALLCSRFSSMLHASSSGPDLHLTDRCFRKRLAELATGFSEPTRQDQRVVKGLKNEFEQSTHH